MLRCLAGKFRASGRVARTVLATLAVFLIAIAPALDAIEDAPHAAPANISVEIDHGLAGEPDGHDCAPTEACAPALAQPPGSWTRLVRSDERIPMVQDHVNDLWHALPDAPVPIRVG